MSPPGANLLANLFDLLPPAGRSLVDQVATLASESGLTAYVVGGPVRDLLLGRDLLDVDIVVEGDALTLAASLADLRSVKAVRHPQFGTATVRADRFALDLVTARSESYERPGALPSVSPGTIDRDLRRRDFSVNAMAVALHGPRRGELLDPTGGEADLRAGVIRALHEGSFRDDATRILRAARYEARFGFQIGSDTGAWIRRDRTYLDAISGARIHHEFVRTFEEAEPERCLLRLSNLGALKAIHSALTFDSDRARSLGVARLLHQRGARSAYWPLLAWSVRPREVETLASRVALRRSQTESIRAVPKVRAIESHLTKRLMRNSRIVEVVSPYPAATLLTLAAMTESSEVRDKIVRYLRRLRRLWPVLNGDDLLAMGASEGPLIGQVLKRIRVAKLDGEVSSRADETRLAERLLRDLSR
ncbi:MAG: CCA tRNA nucleotidyltransferase [Chloroflexi bacterium]|nr:CCA tRNA nucleotidyltransferase [Chloroflexota bacterium]